MKIGKTIALLFLAVFSFLAAGTSGALAAATPDVQVQSRSGSDPAVELLPWDYAWEGPGRTALPGEASPENMPPEGEWRHADRILNPEGRGSSRILWLRSTLPQNMDRSPYLLLQGSQLFEVYCGNRLFYRHGEIEEQGKSYIGTPPRMVPLPEDAEGKPVYIRIYSDGKDIGLLQKPVIGSRSVLYMSYVVKQSARFILGCFYMLVGLMAVYPYYRLKQLHLMSFSCFAVAFGAYTAIRTALIYLIWDNPAFWMFAELVTLMLALASIIAFAEHMSGPGRYKVLNRLWKTHLVYAGTTIPLSMLHVLEVPDILKVYQLLILISIALVIGHVFRVAREGDRDARVMLAGMIIFSGAGAVDIIRQMFFIGSTIPELAYWGVFFFLISLVTVIIRRLIQVLARLSNTEKLSVAGQLAAGVAHEIRNPITVISGYLQLMKKDAANQRTMEIMEGEVNRIQLIVNEFLFLSKPSAPKYGERRMEDIVTDVLRLFESQAESAGVAVHYSAKQAMPAVDCDDNQIKQVLVNVIKNALESMPEGGHMSIVLTEREGVLTVAVTDTGCGITEAELARIGEPFYTTKENGNGLGVMICRRIIENHGGRFMITSAAGDGTTVEIKLPVKRK